jgi:hypothetical protein
VLSEAISFSISAPQDAVGLAVGADHPLVDAPGRLDLDMSIGRERVAQPLALPVGQQGGAGVQGAARLVQRIVLAAAVAVQVLLDPAPAAVQGIAS